jgi:hypothetical protein
MIIKAELTHSNRWPIPAAIGVANSPAISSSSQTILDQQVGNC